MAFVFGILTFFIVVAANAGNDWAETGNGGFVVSCPEKSFVLDLHEAVSQNSALIDTNAASLKSVESRVLYLVDRLAVRDIHRAEMYRSWFYDFFREAQLFKGQKLYPVPDVGFTYIPKECSLELAVFQKTPDFRRNFRYTLDGDIWERLDTLHKAALVLHELIYREAILSGNGHRTSESSRFFNGWLHSEQFLDVELRDYINILQELRFDSVSYQDFVLSLGARDKASNTWVTAPLKFHDNGSIQKASIKELSPAALQKTQKIQHCVSAMVPETADVSALFFNDGSLDRLELTFKNEAPCPYGGIDGVSFSFLADGTSQLAGTAQEDEISVEGVRIVLGESKKVDLSLSAEGHVESVTLEKEPCWNQTHVSLKYFSFTATVLVSDLRQGRLESCFY